MGVLEQRAPHGHRSRHDAEHGRLADRPRKIPLKGWLDVAARVRDEVAADRLDLIAGGVAYYALVALFPMMVAALSLYGLVTSPEALESQVATLSSVMPNEARSLITDQLRTLVQSSGTELTTGAVVGALFALWTASKGTDALISGVGLAYEEKDDRGFVKLKLMSIGLTLGLLVGVFVAFTLVAIVPALFGILGLGSFGRTVGDLVRWPLLVFLFMSGLAVIYRVGPDRQRARWRWITVGSVLATVLWVAASFGFSFYVGRFGDYQATYGSLGGVIILLLWLWISAYLILLGAEINAELEHQTARDSTVGPEAPLGERGAVVADTVGRSRRGDAPPGKTPRESPSRDDAR